MKKKHLGGHMNITNLDAPVFEFLVSNYHITSMVDIGCGPGGMKSMAENFKVDWFGIDGDESIIFHSDNTRCHDFSTGILDLDLTFDLAWSVEFLEHVQEKFIPNFMPLFSKSKYVLITAALPGAPGHHHVNCQTNDYWIEIFSSHGFRYQEQQTLHLRSISEMRKEFFKKSGMFFIKDNS
jgi:hypothetical protein